MQIVYGYDLKARFDMSFKAKTIALSAVALLVVGGSAYTFMSDDVVSTPGDPVVANSAETAEQTNPEALQVVVAEQDKGSVVAPAEVDAKQAASQVQPASQPPKKLTKAQLLPPPATEAEKLEKAAQSESNF
jgi:hypothetical protein